MWAIAGDGAERRAISGMTCSAPGSSGASETIRTVPEAASASSSAGSGSRSEAASCAPRRSSLSHGPSRWVPRMIGSSVAAIAGDGAREHVGAARSRVVASSEVVPRRAWKRAAAHAVARGRRS